MRLWGGRMAKDGARAAWLRVGTVLALFALLSQMAISLLPMPAMGGTGQDGAPLCDLDGAVHHTSPNSGDGHNGHAPDCPVCQAVQLLGGLVPPTPIPMPAARGRVQTVDFPAVATTRPHRAAARHQASAPPSEI